MYKHLNREARYQIQSIVVAQHTTAEIARLLGRHPSTNGREINRGPELTGCLAEQACRKATERSNSKQIPTSLWQRIEPYIRCDWSPEQIGGLFGISHRAF